VAQFAMIQPAFVPNSTMGPENSLALFQMAIFAPVQTATTSARAGFAQLPTQQPTIRSVATIKREPLAGITTNARLVIAEQIKNA